MTGPLAALLLAAAPSLPATQAPPPSAVPGAAVVEAGVSELQAAMTRGTLTSRALVEAYLARIAALDPSLRSVLEVNPDALAIAGALDAERKARGARGPLHGIPVLLKDNIATADALQ